MSGSIFHPEDAEADELLQGGLETRFLGPGGVTVLSSNALAPPGVQQGARQLVLSLPFAFPPCRLCFLYRPFAAHLWRPAPKR